jgi:hypothetical protein
MTARLTGRVAVITDAAGGMGAEYERPDVLLVSADR